MFIELSLQDVSLSEDDIKNAIKFAQTSNINLISCHADSFDKVYDLSKNSSLETSQLLDFPMGCSPVPIKIDMINHAARSGVKYVDIPINSILVYRRKWTKIIDESRACLAEAVKNKLSIRVFVEPNLLDDNHITKLSGLLTEIGINTLILGTGTKIDDINDNLITAFTISKKIGINTIITTNKTLTKEQINTFKKCNIYGIRFTNVNAAKNVLTTLVS